MRTRPLVALAAVSTLVAGAALAGPATAAKKKKDAGATTPTGQIFMVNPVQSSGDQTLTDQNDSAEAVETVDVDQRYSTVPLENLDGSGYLRGKWAVVESATGKPAYSSDGQYIYDRSEDQFEQVMAYFWVNQAQEYLQDLGFDGSEGGLPGIVDEPFAVKVNQYGGDNSYQTDKPYRVRLGKGGVDDAEDAEVIVHEYGHAVLSDQVLGFGQSLDAGAIGEGFSDYFAVSVGLDAAAAKGWPVRPIHDYEQNQKPEAWDPRACFADWDATSYSTNPVKCLRRLDQNFTPESDGMDQVHRRGMIWSRALWDIRNGYEQLDPQNGTEVWDTTLINSQFDYQSDTSFRKAAWVTYHAVDEDWTAARDLVRSAFERRGIFHPKP